MSKSTPDDLVVAFRSFVRRRHEALVAARGAPVGDLLAELDGYIADAATVVRSPANAEAVATAIASRPSEDWDDATLEELRRLATTAGTVVRRIADAGPSGD